MNKVNSIYFYKNYCEKILCFLIENMIESNFDLVNESLFEDFEDLQKIFITFRNHVKNKDNIDIHEDHGAQIIEILKNECNEVDFKKFINKVQRIKSISKCIQVVKRHEELEDILDNIDNFLEEREINRVPTDIYNLDYLLNGGFAQGEFIIISGRPSCGKTSLAIHCAIAALRHFPQRKVLFYSMEMTSLQICERFLNNILSVDREALKEKLKNKSTLLQNIKKLQFRIIDKLNTFESIEQDIKKNFNKHKISIIIIDYLQLLNSTRSSLSRCYELGYITQGLKALSLKLGIPIIGLSQLSRDHLKRQDQTPSLSDLRDSGSLEQDADIVIALSKKYYFNATETKNIELMLSLLKNRSGSIGTIQVIHESTKFKFF